MATYVDGCSQSGEGGGGTRRVGFKMPIDTKSLMGYFSFDKKNGFGNRDGYISPPLSVSRRVKNGNGTMKRIAVVGLVVLAILYFCGFRIPGYTRNKNTVVIILAANLGGGTLFQVL